MHGLTISFDKSSSVVFLSHSSLECCLSFKVEKKCAHVIGSIRNITPSFFLLLPSSSQSSALVRSIHRAAHHPILTNPAIQSKAAVLGPFNHLQMTDFTCEYQHGIENASTKALV